MSFSQESTIRRPFKKLVSRIKIFWHIMFITGPMCSHEIGCTTCTALQGTGASFGIGVQQCHRRVQHNCSHGSRPRQLLRQCRSQVLHTKPRGRFFTLFESLRCDIPTTGQVKEDPQTLLYCQLGQYLHLQSTRVSPVHMHQAWSLYQAWQAFPAFTNLLQMTAVLSVWCKIFT